MSESSPLLPTRSPEARPPPSARPARSVTFNPQVSTSSPPKRRPPLPTAPTHPAALPPTVPRDGTQPMLSALNSKLRRRYSSGSPLILPNQTPASKIGAQRTTRTAQKLKLLPNPEQEDELDEESGREVYSQFTRIKDPTARRDAARLGKDDRARLPRVTAYCTASSYKMDDLMRFLKGRAKTKAANPKLFDECLYSPYRYKQEGGSASGRRRSSGNQEEVGEEVVAQVQSQPVRRFSDSAIEVEENAERRRGDLIDLQREQHDDDATPKSTLDNTNTNNITTQPLATTSSTDLTTPTPTDDHDPHQQLPRPMTPDFDTTVHIPEVFLFEYGVVVLWGLTLKEEQRFLKEIAKFEQEKLGKDDVQTEEFNFYYTREYQARIYNDFISLREKRNYMTKLAISHALAQSTKNANQELLLTSPYDDAQTSLYEDLLSATIDTTQSIPSTIARTGRINLTRREINMQIGELFILRINIHLQGSVLDAPELMWAEPQLEPVYQAVRSYLEMDQRVELMQERVSVVGDLLAVLKDQLSHSHGEYLEWIVIVLIAAEILVAAINIVVDLLRAGQPGNVPDEHTPRGRKLESKPRPAAPKRASYREYPGVASSARAAFERSLLDAAKADDEGKRSALNDAEGTHADGPGHSATHFGASSADGRGFLGVDRAIAAEEPHSRREQPRSNADVLPFIESADLHALRASSEQLDALVKRRLAVVEGDGPGLDSTQVCELVSERLAEQKRATGMGIEAGS
ncbi:hypothetical protein LTR36_001752 [Oleoguttula mirabilis]|uniref:DUF155 domain-containing protein n=1 Tax=Oleoguttula mirabilis TaxID=1507867 RepID=A0AAV9JMG1_9PEZI|nr:hypothetical protein LTR36_001752 [Oleoguttula mirabilis]